MNVRPDNAQVDSIFERYSKPGSPGCAFRAPACGTLGLSSKKHKPSVAGGLIYDTVRHPQYVTGRDDSVFQRMGEKGAT